LTVIGHIDDHDFIADFPLDFGKGIRGEYVTHRRKVAGMVLCHRISGDIGCACSVFWVKVNEQPIYGRLQENPLTIEEDIRCSCGLHGWIRDGKWEHASDSIM
jgi:hypothetical protein